MMEFVRNNFGAVVRLSGCPYDYILGVLPSIVSSKESSSLIADHILSKSEVNKKSIIVCILPLALFFEERQFQI